ncbi:acyltransferase [Yinghuangia aomiensis]|uniref:Acyltransferase n=1 Tax=Yinghuangia aomiensis TaxID=676205 RepID=A0ABP9IBJ0_9ACTN
MDSLTGLRWFAALAVFAFHVSDRAPLPHLYEVSQYGDAGVAFFFVLSGFVLTWSYSPSVPLATFYWRRFARVWPLLLVTTVVAVWALREDVSEVWRKSLMSVGLLQAWFPAGDVFGNPVAWTLSCEAFFYLMLPFVAPLLIRRSPRVLLGCAVAVVMAMWAYRYFTFDLIQPTDSHVRLQILRFPAGRFLEFLLGIIAASAVRQGWRTRIRPWHLLIVLGGLLYGLDWLHNQPWTVASWTIQALAPLFALLIAVSAIGDIEGRRTWMASPPLVALGTWSYAFYLVHILVMDGLTGTVVYDRSATWDNLVPVAVWLVLSLVASYAAYRFVEHPCEARLRRMSRYRPVPPAGGGGNGRPVTDRKEQPLPETAMPRSSAVS